MSDTFTVTGTLYLPDGSTPVVGDPVTSVTPDTARRAYASATCASKRA